MDRNILLNFYKGKPPTFGNIQKKREVDSSRLKNDRHARRTDRFNARRNIGNEEESKLNILKELPKKTPIDEASKIMDRKLALQKFKKEKEALQKASKKNVRPPFKVGIPHHGSSPMLRDLTNHDCLTNKHRPVQEVRPQRVTRAMSKTTNAPKENHLPIRTKNKPILKVAKDIKAFPFKEPKSVFTFKPKKVESVKKLTSPHTPTVLKRSARKTRTVLTDPRSKVVKSISSLYKSTPSTSSGEMLAVPLTDVVTDVASPVPKEEPLSPSAGPENADAEFHRNRLDDETRRLLSLADLWEQVALLPKIPREVMDEIDSLVGQTRLLTRDKFNQFRGLVDQFESGATTAASIHPITLDDLDGFWEMMYLQVESLIKRYNELETLKNNNWVKPKAPTPPRKRRKIAVKPKGTPRPSTALRAAIQARRTRPKQVTTPPVTQDSMKTPTDQSSLVHNLMSCAKQPRNSNSPYIVLRLSGIGRSIGRSSRVGMYTPDLNTTCKSTTKSEETSDVTGVLEPQPIIKSEATELEESNDEDFGISSIFELKPYMPEATLVNTPRRSVRLLGKSPTPLKSRMCGVCSSPKCNSEEHRKEIKNRSLRKSRKTCKFNLSPLEQNQIGDVTAPDIDTSGSTGAIKPVGNKFSLRPSKLVVSETITFASNPGGRRRSVRISNARKVTFDAGTEEKRSFKLPATPYRKSGVQQTQEDSDDD